MTGISDQLRERTVDTVLGTVRVQVGGTGEPIVFWPSLLMTGDMWHGVADGLVTRSQVVLVDPPGHGGSQPLTDMFTFGDCARCVVDILDGLGLDQAHFVGNSWGGMIGATFAATYPERIGRAVLMNCTAGPASVRQKFEYAMLLRLAQWHGEIGPLLISLGAQGIPGADDLSGASRRCGASPFSGEIGRYRVRLLGGEERGSGPPRPTGVVGRHHDTGARCRGRRGRHLPTTGSDRDGRCHPELLDSGARRGGSPRRPGRSRIGERFGRRVSVRGRRKRF